MGGDIVSADPQCPHCGGSGEVTYLDTTPRFSTALSPREITGRCDCDEDYDAETYDPADYDDGADYARDVQWDREHEDRPDFDEEAA